LLLQSQLYSSYKSNTTLKGLIEITPHGAVSLISSLHTGSISDKEISRCSGILDLLERGDSVMVDKGFNIDDLLKEKGVGLKIPPFLQSQAQYLFKMFMKQNQETGSSNGNVKTCVTAACQYFCSVFGK